MGARHQVRTDVRAHLEETAERVGIVRVPFPREGRDVRAGQPQLLRRVPVAFQAYQDVDEQVPQLRRPRIGRRVGRRKGGRAVGGGVQTGAVRAYGGGAVGGGAGTGTGGRQAGEGRAQGQGPYERVLGASWAAVSAKSRHSPWAVGEASARYFRAAT